MGIRSINGCCFSFYANTYQISNKNKSSPMHMNACVRRKRACSKITLNRYMFGCLCMCVNVFSVEVDMLFFLYAPESKLSKSLCMRFEDPNVKSQPLTVTYTHTHSHANKSMRHAYDKNLEPFSSRLVKWFSI